MIKFGTSRSCRASREVNIRTVYHESFEAEKFRGFRGFLVLRETFFHENISVAIEKQELIAITMGIRESFFVKICVMH